MQTITTILYCIGMIMMFLFAMGIFIQTSRELWESFLEDYGDWFKTTRIGMWYNNKKNGVTILTDRKYAKLCATKKIVDIDVIQE